MNLPSCLLAVMLITSTLTAELKILNLPEGDTGPPPCALTCSGISKHDQINGGLWKKLNGQAIKNITISECGFVSAPVITATVRGPWEGLPIYRCTAIYIKDVSEAEFSVLTADDVGSLQMASNRCDVYWVANGFNC